MSSKHFGAEKKFWGSPELIAPSWTLSPPISLLRLKTREILQTTVDWNKLVRRSYPNNMPSATWWYHPTYATLALFFIMMVVPSQDWNSERLWTWVMMSGMNLTAAVCCKKKLSALEKYNISLPFSFIAMFSWRKTIFFTMVCALWNSSELITMENDNIKQPYYHHTYIYDYHSVLCQTRLTQIFCSCISCHL